MKIGKIYQVTKIYHSSKGNDYCLVGVELLEIGEDQKDMWNPVMYGTIAWNDIDKETRRLKRILNLGSMSLGKTVAEAIQRREDMEAIDGMSLEEIVEYFKSKM